MMTYNFRSTCLKFSAVAVFMLFLQVSFAQTDFTDFTSTLEARKKDLGTDFVVAISNTDTIVYQKAFGEATPKIQLPIGATSQWLTAAMIMVLVDEGKLSLDDKIGIYLPIYDKYFKSYITIRHCLTHMTGIKWEPFTTTAAKTPIKFASLEEQVADYAKKEIQTNAGEEFRYNGIGPNIAASVIEVVTKKKFEAIIKTKLFTPMGMRNTAFTTEDGSPGNAAFGAKSTVADLSKFMQMLLNNGKYNGKQILSEASVAEMKKIQVPKEKMKGVPKITANYMYALGSWTTDGENVGDAVSAFVSPGFTGTWAMIDFKNGNAFVILPKSFTGEQNTNIYNGISEEIFEMKIPAHKK